MMSGSTEKVRASVREAMRNRTVTTEIGESIPRGLRVATAYAWRLVVIASAIGIVIWLVIQLKLLVIPFMVALLLTALLWPVFTWMLRRGLPRWLAVVIALVGTMIVVGGLLYLVAWQISMQWGDVKDRTAVAVDSFRQYLISGPLHLTEHDINQYLDQAWKVIQEQASSLWTGALAIGSTVGHVGTGAVLSFFILICTLADGGSIWKWVLRLFPRNARPAIDDAGTTGWRTVVNYARTQLFVATIDAVGIGLGAFLLGVPLAIPVAVLVFLGSFIPVVGAVVTGTLAVFLALVYNGPLTALWMVLVVLAVQQLEGHVLQPILMGSAVKVHPLAVVLAVAGGAMIAGIPGALFAVPVAAFVNTFADSVASRRRPAGGDEEPPDAIWSTVPRERKKDA